MPIFVYRNNNGINGTWTSPPAGECPSHIKVECMGAGGKGGASPSGGGVGGGGGGGAYAMAIIPIEPDTVYSFYAARTADGTGTPIDSYWEDGSILKAVGGYDGGTDGSPGTPGLAVNCNGDVCYSGGWGGEGVLGSYSGAGGGGAGTYEDGNDAVNRTYGDGKRYYGGYGASGRTGNYAGVSAPTWIPPLGYFACGGGGGGAHHLTSARAGGDSTPGLVVIHCLYEFEYGDGSIENPYQIWNITDFEGVLTHFTGYFKQMIDLDFDTINWEPDVPSDFLFKGHYDGNGFAINNLSSITTGKDYQSLFGAADQATIINVTINDCYISSTGWATGALIGSATRCNIDNCHVVNANLTSTGEGIGGLVGYAESSVVNDCSVINSNIHGEFGGIGGIIGSVYELTLTPYLNQCIFEGNITGINSSDCGGLIGECSAKSSYAAGFYIYNSYAYVNLTITNGTYIGGIIGGAYCKIGFQYCYAIGSLEGTSNIGGVCGYADEGNIDFCYVATTINGTSNLDGFISESADIDVNNCYYNGELSGMSGTVYATPLTTLQMYQIASYSGWNFEIIWNIDVAVNNNYPYLRVFYNEVPEPTVFTDLEEAKGYDLITYEMIVNRASFNDGYPFLQWQSFDEIATYMGLDYLNLNLAVEKPSLHLTKPDRTIVGILESAYNIKLRLELGGVNELSFTMPYKIDINNILEDDPNVYKVRDFYLIKLIIGDYSDWYIIQPTSETYASDSDEKNVTCYHLSHQLSSLILKNYQRTSITPFEMLDEILAESVWIMGYISPSLRYKYRTYEIGTKTVLNFLLQDVAETLGCFVMFDTENRLIHLVNPEEIGANKGLIFSYRNYLDTLNKQIEPQDFATHFKLYGKNGLQIHSVNPTGLSYIFDYSYFLYPFERDEFGTVIHHSDYMSDSLCHAILDYQEKLDNKKGIETIALTGTTEINLVIEEIATVGDYILNTTRGYEFREVLEIDGNNLTIDIIDDQDVGDIIYLYKDGSFRKLLFKETDLLSIKITLENIIYFLNLLKTMALDREEVQRENGTFFYDVINTSSSPYSETVALDTENYYMWMLKITSPSASNYTVSVDGSPVTLTHNTWEVIKKIENSASTTTGISFTGTLEGEIICCRIGGDEFNGVDLETQEVITNADLLQRYNHRYLTEEIDEVQIELDAIVVDLGSVQDSIANLRQELSRTNVDNFTAVQLQELYPYIKEKEWTNSYLFNPIDLYEEGIIAFQEFNKPQTHISISIINFLECIEEQHHWDKMVLGDLVNIKYEPFNIDSTQAKIMELSFDFESQNVDIVLTNPLKKLLTPASKSMRILSESITTGNIVDIGTPIWNEVAAQFSGRNNRISTPIAIPTIIDIGHSINTDGTANIEIEWEFLGDGDEYAIDGFSIYVRAFPTPSYYVFGSGAGREQVYNVNADRTVFTIYGVPADAHYYFGIEGFRHVDTDINTNGIIKSVISQSSGYQPVIEVTSGSSTDWSNIANKPSTFTPSAHGNTAHNVVFMAEGDIIKTNQIKTDSTTPQDLTITTGTEKTLVLNTPVYNDINTGLNPRNTGANRPTLEPMTGNISEFQFAVNNYADLTPIELMHDWKEGTPIELHIHWATGGTNDATVRGVKWQIEYAYASMNSVYSSATTESKETSIAANETALTPKYTSVVTFTPATTIGTQLSFMVKRIASVDNIAPVDDPFLLSIGIHYQIDTIGSRTMASK